MERGFPGYPGVLLGSHSASEQGLVFITLRQRLREVLMIRLGEFPPKIAPASASAAKVLALR